MRVGLAVLGMAVLGYLAVMAAGFGALAFTPGPAAHRTSPFTSYDQWALLLMMGGPWVILVGAGLATFVRASRGPRAYWPYVGIGLIVVLVVVATKLTRI